MMLRKLWSLKIYPLLWDSSSYIINSYIIKFGAAYETYDVIARWSTLAFSPWIRDTKNFLWVVGRRPNTLQPKTVGRYSICLKNECGTVFLLTNQVPFMEVETKNACELGSIWYSLEGTNLFSIDLLKRIQVIDGRDSSRKIWVSQQSHICSNMFVCLASLSS